MFNRFLEFFIVGVILGVVEDVIAVTLATDSEISLKFLSISFFVAIPFAIFSELIVDHDKFRQLLRKMFNKARKR